VQSGDALHAFAGRWTALPMPAGGKRYKVISRRFECGDAELAPGIASRARKPLESVI
jgi:hypothetical protein